MLWKTIASVFIFFSIKKCCDSSFMDVDALSQNLDHRTSPNDPSKWHFASTRIEGLGGREAKLGDTCFYPAWVKHAQPILDAMVEYNKGKRNFQEEYRKAKQSKETTATSAEDYIRELANRLSEARVVASLKLKNQIFSGNRSHPLDIRESLSDASNLMELLCEGGDLMQCKQLGQTEFGVCRCFDLPEEQSMYNTEQEDGHCRGASGSTCNNEDPVFAITCLGRLACINFSKSACEFEMGPHYHCTGSKLHGIGKQNHFCSRTMNHPEHENDASGHRQWSSGYTPGILLDFTTYVSFNIMLIFLI